ncbi:tRNA 2-thiouridine(34) synthase MnmA [Bacteroides sp. OF04-15BH]|uniref:tRNA 2-thiouridine(34) synthase MnmA n=1 Tax=Bacteroides sp. OF04-15BH TaxID=2292281 RepID=UPI000E506988|nr:tRNA 2-thiouridine(34) synthase MnmA [Bacteroides sp. OF04-15BH]RHP67030.1 tRNA 2-thiouridine(34) synthase MnmA [Bacteroides sp. OF04-15BH]
MKKKVLVGMSGGIDSSSVCLMLKDKGYEVIGITMRVWDLPQHFSEPGQEQPNHVMQARELAERLGIEHYVADERASFKDVVVRNFIDEYLNGRTPNPCVMCNPTFKFRMLMEWADRLGCDYIATGHYVQKVEQDGSVYLKCGADTKKDQSYFLWRLSQEVLRRCIFPLGDTTKDKVRAYLTEKGFEAKARGGESMEVCFIPGDYREFLKEQLPDLEQKVGPGDFVDEQGHKLGRHQGFPFYTVGQRKGLGIALGKPAFVLKINPQKNTVMLGDADRLMTEYMLVEQPNWVNADALPAEGLAVRIRYRSKPIPCTLKKVNRLWEEKDAKGDLYLVHFHEPASAVTPGQSAVFYVDDLVVGGGYIVSQKGIHSYIEEFA